MTSSSSDAHLAYRPDIDGLRAIAVMSVVIFHAFPTLMQGGFIGVDIFFVISGFLISGILFKSLYANAFSFKDFYLRRILRIFPALTAVLAIFLSIGWWVLLPAEFQQLGKHVLSGTLFLSNIFLWKEAGYFDAASVTKPLLHLWSLGIEEQFYIVWPCLILLVHRLRWAFVATIAVFILGSFAGNILLIDERQSAVFYLPVTRFWELLLGSMLAYIHTQQARLPVFLEHSLNKLGLKTFQLPLLAKHFNLNDLSSIAGISLIVASLVWVDASQFPGYWALMPTLGACLIIAAGPAAILNKIMLSGRSITWFGKISYPLYLWHWPLLSFATIIEVKTPAASIRAAAVLLAIALAWLTYRFIEHPLRFNRHKITTAVSLCVAMVILGLTGARVYHTGNQGNQWVTQPMLDTVAKLNFGLQFEQWSECPDPKNKWHCKLLDHHQPTDVMMIGDSHAAHLAAGLAEVKSLKNHNVIMLASNGCMPVFATEAFGKPYFNCEDNFINNALSEAIASKTLKTIMLSGFAVLHIRPQDENHQLINLAKDVAEHNAAAMASALDTTLTQLVASGKRIVFFVDVPALNYEPTECINVRPLYFPWHQQKQPCGFSRAQFEQQSAEYHQIIAKAAITFPTVKFIHLYEPLCDDALCYAIKDDVLLYRDYSHLSAEGSRYLFKKLENSFTDI